MLQASGWAAWHHADVSSDSTNGAPPVTVWRVSTLGQVTTWVAIAASLCAAVLITVVDPRVPGDGPWDNAIFSLALFVGALCLWRAGIHPRMTATPQRLTIQNPAFTKHVRWEEIRSVTPGYSGLQIERSNGRAITVWAVQQANFSTWLNRATRSQTVAQELMTLARQWGTAAPCQGLNAGPGE